MDESPPQSSSSSAMGSGTTFTSSIHRRDRPRRPSSPSIEKGSPALSDNTTTRQPSLAPPLGEFRKDPSSPCIVSTSQPQQPATSAIDPLMSDDSGSERGVKRRRRSSAFERCDEMRRMSMKRCNGSGSFSAGTGGSAATVGREVEGQHRPHEQDGTHHPTPTTNVTGSLVSSTSSSSSTTSASASTSSLVLDLHATTLSSSPQPLPRPWTRPQPVFTCPFTSYTKDRQDQTQPPPLHCSEDHPHEICGRNRRNSSISSQYTRRDSGWSTAESRRGTLTSGFSSPSTSTSAVDMTSQHNKQECKPFPMDRLPRDILNLILDHVLKSPEFGHNGRWKDKQGLDEDKVQMVKALKASASIHLKFSLIHRSWTPHVIKSLYRFPRLTSKDAIEKFDRAIQNPLSLWGSELMPDGQIGGVLGFRGRYVRFISYCVGSGRHSATDYLMWSGSWFADVAGRLIAQLTNTQGWACEGWCSKGCEESRQIEIFKYPEEDRIVLERLTILRSPLPADILALTLSQTKGMRALELLDVQKHYLIDGNLELVKRGLKMATCLETFAIKVEGGVEQEGPLDDVLTIVPTLRHLSMQADLLSLNFFAISRTSELQSILIGFATRLPVLFHGREALETLWSEAQAETIYSRARQQAQFVFAEGTTFQGAVTHRMTLNSTMISINGAANARSSPAPSMVFNQPLMLSSSSPRPGPFLTTNDMEGSSLSSMPQLGLESWLVRELGNPNSAISKASLTGDDAMAVYASYTHHPPV